MLKYRLSCIVDKELVPTITALIIDRVHSYHVEEVGKEDKNGAPFKSLTPGRQKSNAEAWMREPGKAILEFMKKDRDKVYEYNELQPVIVKIGLAAASISPLLSNLHYSGHVKRVKRGHYRLP